MRLKTRKNKSIIAIIFVAIFAALVFGVFFYINLKQERTVDFNNIYKGTKSINVSDNKRSVIDDSSFDYSITGTANKGGIVINGGTESSPIKVTIENLEMNFRHSNNDESEEISPITITPDSYAEITVKGDNKLVGGNDVGWGHNDGYAGICIAKNANLTIKGDGYLEAIGGGNGQNDRGAAGIGTNSSDCENYANKKIKSGNYSDMGNLIIEGDVSIKATGAKHAAGIGGGRDGDVSSITINDNVKIEARGGDGAPGIGTGDDIVDGDEVYLGKIVINNCEYIYAHGTANGAGIGGGQSTEFTDGIYIYNCKKIEAIGGGDGAGIGGGDNNNGAKVYISGNGEINATGGEHSAGIGAGDNNTRGEGSITIEGEPNIIATGGEGAAGIGSGDYSSKDGMPITINMDSAGKINARGGKEGAGIGGGHRVDRNNITITGLGIINAVGGKDSCGIGSAEAGEGGIINITGKTNRDLSIFAYGDGEAAAIGSSQGKGGNISIKNATVDTHPGRHGSGIGNGYDSEMGDNSIDTISIDNCSVKTYIPSDGIHYGVGIGGGAFAPVKNIFINNSDYEGNSIGTAGASNVQKKEADMNKLHITNCGTIIAKAHENNTGKDDEKLDCTAGIGPGEGGEIKEILISDCNYIEAEGVRGGAGIGSSGLRYGSDTFNLIISGDGGKVGNLTIRNCNTIKAKGSTGANITKVIKVPTTEPGVTEPEKVAYGSFAGAGIGAGTTADFDSINISNCDNIQAIGGDDLSHKKGAAGIGGSGVGVAGTIDIDNCNNIVSTGGACASGIGSGGIDDLSFKEFGEVGDNNRFSIKEAKASMKSVRISNCENVVATGSYRGAGVGGGETYKVKGNIEIKNTNLVAKAGESAAGIGTSGGQEYLYKIILQGSGKIEAYGGKCGAGIGVGENSYLNGDVLIKKNTLYDMTGSTLKERMAKSSVLAVGGEGAAGIGNGKYYRNWRSGSNDVKCVSITGGYVNATGGDGAAGIGTGQGTGLLKTFRMTGGVVEASGFNDIGLGKDASSLGNHKYTISAGTLLAETMSFTPTIYGGSVKAYFKDAKSDENIRVYQTKLKAIEPLAQVATHLTDADENDYCWHDIYSDEDNMLYLYLPEKNVVFDDFNTVLELVYLKNSINYKRIDTYYGNVTSQVKDNWLKMIDKLTLIGPSTQPIIGDEAKIEVKYDELPIGSTVTFNLNDNDAVTLVDKKEAVDSNPAYIKIKAKDFGEYTILAKSNTSKDNDMYWYSCGRYIDKIKVDRGQVEITENNSKVYDGQPVEDPSVYTNSDNNVVIEYMDSDNNILPIKPSNVGTYKVHAKVNASNNYTAAEDTKEFKIYKRPISMEIKVNKINATDSNIKVITSNMIPTDTSGNVVITIKENDENGTLLSQNTLSVDDAKNTGLTFTGIASGNYYIEAEFIDNDNYIARKISNTFSKEKANRNIIIDRLYTATYGEDDFVLNPSTDASTENDKYSFEVVGDLYEKWPEFNAEPSVNVDDNGKIIVKHAGVSAIRITLSEDTATRVYNDESVIVLVKVDKANLKVTSKAVRRSRGVALGESLSVEYGMTKALDYYLDYLGFVNHDDADTFTHGYGKLLAKGPGVTESAGNDKRIDIIQYKAGSKLFYSRDYDIDKEYGTIDITKAPLTITAKKAVNIVGLPERNYEYDIEGLRAFESIEDVVLSTPRAFYDDSILGKLYSELTYGLYQNVIGVTDITNLSLSNYSLNVENASLRLLKYPTPREPEDIEPDKDNESIDPVVPSVLDDNALVANDNQALENVDTDSQIVIEKKSPKTGDEIKDMVDIILLIIAFSLLVGVVRYSKRQE